MKFILLCFFLSSAAYGKNLHLVDQASNGFAIYRYGQPSKKDMGHMKELGISEVMVLSGDAEGSELEAGFQIFYNKKQSDNIPVSKEFLKAFDGWVAKARAEGKKIAFRCECGCHRTGRLAAYYQMKNQHITAEDAIAIMNKHGKLMVLHKHLYPQVLALHDYILGKPCSQKSKYCLTDELLK